MKCVNESYSQQMPSFNVFIFCETKKKDYLSFHVNGPTLFSNCLPVHHSGEDPQIFILIYTINYSLPTIVLLFTSLINLIIFH